MNTDNFVPTINEPPNLGLFFYQQQETSVNTEVNRYKGLFHQDLSI